MRPAPPATDRALSRLLQETEAELAGAGGLWQRRLDDAQAEWGRQLTAAEGAAEARVAAVARDAEARLSDGAREWERRLRDCEAGWRAKVADADATWGERGGARRCAPAGRRLLRCVEHARPKAHVRPHRSLPPGARYAAERQAWEHDRSDWDHWRGRLQEDLDAARACAGLDVRKGLAAQLEEAGARAAADRAAIEKCATAARVVPAASKPRP